jgi:hypothetical protein
VLFGAQVLLEASMNMGGHCGYLLPHWLQALVTGGIGNTPWSGEQLPAAAAAGFGDCKHQQQPMVR